MNDLVASPFGASGAVATQQTAGARQSQARELAEIQTMYLMAQQFPRDERKAMDGIINAFSRRSLAERSQYQYSKGGSEITGPSIHAAQAIAQQWQNIKIGWRTVSRGIGPDGVPYSEVEAFAIDLQGRMPSGITFFVPHWRDTKKGGYKLTDERDIYELCSNMAQRRKRACILSVVPQDVIDTAMEQAERTLKANADTSPEAMAKMVEAFAPFGVSKDQIEKKIQRRLDSISPAQVVTLKRIYASLRDGMSSPEEWFDAEPPADADAAPTTGAAGLKEALRQRGAAPAPAPASGTPAPAQGEKTRRAPKPVQGEHALTADEFIKRIEDAAGPEDAEALLLAAEKAQLSNEDFERVQKAHAIAWTDGASA